MSLVVRRPAPDEYAPFYGAYVQRTPEGDIFAILTGQIEEVSRLLTTVTEAHADFRTAPSEWSIKEIVGHISDVERVFSYRALRISRHDQTPLPGFEQVDYVRESNFGARTLADLVQEFEYLRRANLLAFQHLSEAVSLRRGLASDREISVRAIIYILAGHAYQHLDSINDEYLPGVRAL